MKKIIATKNAPAAIGPYSQGIDLGSLIFTSGQLGMDPSTGEFVSDDVSQQAEQAFKNIKAILEEAGSNMDNIIKTTCFLKNMNDFAKVNEIYVKFLGNENCPARSAVQVAELPKGGLVEIEAIAIK